MEKNYKSRYTGAQIDANLAKGASSVQGVRVNGELKPKDASGVVDLGNIEADGAVRYDRAQSLSKDEKEQARDNIGAVDASYVQQGIATESEQRMESFNYLNNKVEDFYRDAYNEVIAEQERATEAESGLSARIDAIVQGRDVRDIVGNYAELLAYDTTTLGDNDIIMVLLDNTKSDHTTYYRWHTDTQSWEFIGGLAFTYTKTEIDEKFRALHIVLPSIPADAVDNPEEYQELLAQVDSMVRGAGADASFKMPVSVAADINGNVNVTFVKSNPAHLYLGIFADDMSKLYHITRTTTTPRTYTLAIVENVFATDKDLESKEDKAVLLYYCHSESPQKRLAETFNKVLNNQGNRVRFLYESSGGNFQTVLFAHASEHHCQINYHDRRYDSASETWHDYGCNLAIHKDEDGTYRCWNDVNESANKSELTELQLKVGKFSEITPTLSSGVQIATLKKEVEGQEVTTPLYAPQGGGESGKQGVISQTITYNNDGTKTYSNIVRGTIPDNLIFRAGLIGVTFNEATGYFEKCLKDYTKTDIEESLLLLNNIGSTQETTYVGANIRLSCIYARTAGYLSFSGLFAFAGKTSETLILGSNSNVNNLSSAFRRCEKLEYVQDIRLVSPATTITTDVFEKCGKLKHIHISNLPKSISFKDSSFLENESVLFMISNASSEAGIVITLHANAYARAMADADIQSALATHTNVTLASA